MFGIIGQLLTAADDRDRLIEILLEGTRNMPGCRLYAISKDVEDAATIWITDMRTFADMNEVWDAWIDPANPPVRACVESRLAAPGFDAEIGIIAAK